MSREQDDQNMLAQRDQEEVVDVEEFALEMDPVDAKRLKAHRLRMTGMSWAEVAARAGYKSEKEAHSQVQIWYQQSAVSLSAQTREEALTEAIAALDELQAKNWAAALEGDEKAAGVVLKCIAQKARLTGIEQVQTENLAAKVLVIQGHEREYVKKLQTLVEGKLAKPRAAIEITTNR